MSTKDIKSTVRERYGQAALRVATGSKTSCCGGGSCGTSTRGPDYLQPLQDAETATLPAEAVLGFAGLR